MRPDQSVQTVQDRNASGTTEVQINPSTSSTRREVVSVEQTRGVTVLRGTPQIVQILGVVSWIDPW